MSGSMAVEKADQRLTSVYVHFPWCARKCPYCDFATVKMAPEAVPHVAYADALLRELQLRQASVEGRTLASIFFGGGTPSLWDAHELKRVLDAIRGAFDDVVDDLEITAESNPASLTRSKAAGFREAGVGRLSIGVQSLDDAKLKFLGRLHDRAGALKAVHEATLEMPRVSADFMFGMPDQTVEGLTADLDAMLATGVHHVSAYALTIEKGTLFGELHRLGKLRTAREETYAEMFFAAERRFAEHGLAHYEVSNYARPGHESRHNLHYWRAGDYFALGAAAVGCLGSESGASRYRNEPLGTRYLEKAASAVRPSDLEESREALTPATRVQEAWMLGLRTSEGVHAERVQARTGRDVLEGREKEVAGALERGDLTFSDGRYRVPSERWIRLDGIVASVF